MSTLTITDALQNVVDAVDVGREIYQTTVNAMDAAEKERDSGADKKAWVLAFVKSFITDLGQNWERWAKVIITFIDFAKSIFNSKRYS
ncbi:hypothetical protein HXZ60_09305 [Acinetobacter towneri]|uniref:hypothetical protein n=1 Tax=Acinetobacter towneri TaxID=202956 RepID=UPI002577F253|nr:hypothetical protein [Acinetobacter towneri]MDM1283766.1 hypothetical protein [Acinetobacter towneri]